ncbi:hypothetical protein AHAS_Ahas04G0051600 [Arachis hypogaea]
MEKEKTKMTIKRKRAKEEENENETKKITKKRDRVNKTKEKEKEMEKKKAKAKENKRKTKESEECNFLDCGEDSFLLSSSCFSEASTMANVLPDEEKLIMEDLWQPFESDDGLELNLDASNDDLNCIWSSLLSNPL